MKQKNSKHFMNKFLPLFRKQKLQKELIQTLQLNSKADWPQNVKRVYLDGNNMLFINSKIRSMFINKDTQTEAQKKFATFCFEFTKKMALEKTSLIFDFTELKQSEETFEIISAKDCNFETTDDMLVEYAEIENMEECIFVTSDYGLQKRLKVFDATILRPTLFLTFAVSIIYDKPNLVSNLDLLDEYFNKN